MSFKILLIAAFLGALWAFSPGFLFYAGVVCGIAWFLFAQYKNIFLFQLFFWGLGLRILCSLILWDVVSYGHEPLYYMNGYSIPYVPFFEDISYYLIRGFWLLKIHHGEITNLPTFLHYTSSYGESLYLHFIAIVYYFFGYCPEIINFINCLFGILISFISYFIVLEIWNHPVWAKVTALCVTFFPTLFFMSLIANKDIPIIFLQCLIVLSIIKFSKSYKITYLLSILLNLWLIHLIRPIFMFKGILLGAIASLFVIHPMHWIRKCMMVMLFLGMYFYSDPQNLKMLHQKTFSLVNYFYMTHVGYIHTPGYSRYKFLDKDIYYQPGYNENIALALDWKRQSLTILRACLHFLFEPFLWQKQKSKALWMLFPEMIFLWFMLPFVMIGIVISIRRRSVQALLFYICWFIIPMALSNGNVGAAVRFRQFVTPFYCMFFVVGGMFILNNLLSKSPRNPNGQAYSSIEHA